MPNGGGYQDTGLIDFGEFGGAMGAPRGKVGRAPKRAPAPKIERVGGYRPPGGRAPAAAKARAASKLVRITRAALKKAAAPRPMAGRVAVGVGVAGVVAGLAGIAVTGGGASRPPTLPELARAFRPTARERGAIARTRAGGPAGETARRIRATAAAGRAISQQKGVSSEEAASSLRRTRGRIIGKKVLKLRPRW